ncbi:hypothetical protein [Fuchsiella alkaliacetigena]|uniref:hypothetical protein n=1 Tax=Fuchsiella alkaliacetigena TaxID=957042 RepID=UPI00200B282F|nr:hypothetical protein [Fuchsiella alkaliacetigena]MCK8825540.1 hypothetical protein [Fuchsiella alkaliacetigena]
MSEIIDIKKVRISKIINKKITVNNLDDWFRVLNVLVANNEDIIIHPLPSIDESKSFLILHYLHWLDEDDLIDFDISSYYSKKEFFDNYHCSYRVILIIETDQKDSRGNYIEIKLEQLNSYYDNLNGEVIVFEYNTHNNRLFYELDKKTFEFLQNY